MTTTRRASGQSGKGGARPPLHYFGGKQRIAERIVALFPDHSHYVEPFAGGLSVLLAKPLSAVETVNDLDRSLVTFWRVLRDHPEELIRACLLTPHSRAELADCHQHLDRTGDVKLGELEVARRVWVQLSQGRNGTRRRTGWRFTLDGTNTPLSDYLTAYLQRMPAAAARLSGVQLECRDALQVIADYGTRPDTLLYVDPPYPVATRNGLRYAHEMGDPAAHHQLAEQLHACRARVVLSGYPCDLYDQLYAGWTQHRFKAFTAQAGRPGIAERTEACWTNFDPPHHLFNFDTPHHDDLGGLELSEQHPDAA